MLDYAREGLPDWDYAVTVTRATQPDRFEIYTATLQKRLPRFRLPLASDDRDMVVDLQTIYARARVQVAAKQPVPGRRFFGKPLHGHGPFDRLAIPFEPRRVLRERDGHDAAVNVRRQSPVEPDFFLAVEAALVEVGTDHRLADPEPLEAMLEACDVRTR